VFSSLLSALENGHKLVVTAVELKQREAEKRVERLVKDLEKEILELDKGHANIELLNDKERLKKVITFLVLFAGSILSFLLCVTLSSLCYVIMFFQYRILKFFEYSLCCFPHNYSLMITSAPKITKTINVF